MALTKKDDDGEIKFVAHMQQSNAIVVNIQIRVLIPIHLGGG